MTIGTGHTMTTTDGTQYISSRDIAEWTEKRHDNLMRDIENYISVLSENEHSSDLSHDCSSKLRNSITPRVEGYLSPILTRRAAVKRTKCFGVVAKVAR
ncbi:TPA: Rha family transcriptional regulator [Streptococcus suis]|nr:Rha family transcriptional regulator [Streptococcus suis]